MSTNYTVSVSKMMDLFTGLNQITNDSFWVMTIFIIWLVSFVALSKGTQGKGMSISFFITLILASLLNFAGLVEFYVVGVSFAGFIACLFLIRGN